MSQRGGIAIVFGLGQTLGRGALAAYTIVVVHYLAQSEYGDVAFAIAVAAMASTVADFGFSRIIVRNVSRATDQGALVRELLRVRAFGIGAVGALAGLGILVGVVDFDLPLAIGFLTYFTAESIAFGYESACVAIERPWRFAMVQGLGALALGGAVIALALIDNPTPGSVMAGLGAASSIKVLGHMIAWRDTTSRPRQISSLPVKMWLGQALPFFVLAVISTIYYRLGIVVLYAGQGPDETAPFAAAMRVMDAVALVGYVAFSAVSPALSRAHRDRPSELWRLWKRMVVNAALVALPAIGLLFLFAEPVAGLLFGERYEESVGTLLRLLAPGMGFLLLQSLSAAVLLMGDQQRGVVLLSAINVSVNLILALILSGVAGAEGVAIATSAAEALSFVSFGFLARRRYRTT